MSINEKSKINSSYNDRIDLVLKRNKTLDNTDIQPDQILEKIKEEERIYHPVTWKWRLVLNLSIAAFALFIGGLIKVKENISSHDFDLIIMASSILIISILLSWYKQNKNAFSIRLNAYGMMVTDFHSQIWYPWHHIDNIHTRYYREHKRVLFETKNQKNRDKFDDAFQLDITSLPRNYDITPDQMASLLCSYKRQYTEMKLHKFPELETEAKKLRAY